MLPVLNNHGGYNCVFPFDNLLLIYLIFQPQPKLSDISIGHAKMYENYGSMSRDLLKWSVIFHTFEHIFFNFLDISYISMKLIDAKEIMFPKMFNRSYIIKEQCNVIHISDIWIRA